jgi:hypothetical protein
MRRTIREVAFNLARRDVALFLADHEEELLAIFREEMYKLDEEIPEERLFIDIKMVPLGEAILKSALHTISRFLLEDHPDDESFYSQLGDAGPEPAAVTAARAGDNPADL